MINFFYYQQLTSISRACHRSRNAICCILATIPIPRDASGLPQYYRAVPTDRTGKKYNQGREEQPLFCPQTSFGTTVSRSQMRLKIRSLKVTMLLVHYSHGKWLIVAIRSLLSGILPLGELHYPRNEQFWGGLFGRPVILWIRDASYCQSSLAIMQGQRLNILRFPSLLGVACPLGLPTKRI